VEYLFWSTSLGGGTVFSTTQFDTHESSTYNGQSSELENSHTTGPDTGHSSSHSTHTYTVAIGSSIDIDISIDAVSTMLRPPTAAGGGAYVMLQGTLSPIVPSLKIDDVSQSTFIVGDSITFHANVGAPIAGVQVQWTVEGQDAAMGITGFPTNVVTTTDATGGASFTFTPSNNSNLVNDRHTTWTKGSLIANTALTFQITASATLSGQSIQDTKTVTQDPKDQLREEYYDYGIPVPTRNEIVASLGAGFNQGNYSVQLSDGLETRYDAILAAYRGRPITVSVGGKQFSSAIPIDASVDISSGYRNPQRNKAKDGAKLSKHMFGQALDLVPNPSMRVMINGRLIRVTVPLHGANGLYAALQDAAASQAGNTAIAEQDATQVPVGDTRENHIHVQW
jgi:Peptidase M15